MELPAATNDTTAGPEPLSDYLRAIGQVPLLAAVEELALAHAEILGWLEGLFQGTQLAIQMQAARAFQEQQRRLSGGPPIVAEPDRGEDGRYL